MGPEQLMKSVKQLTTLGDVNYSSAGMSLLYDHLIPGGQS